MITTVCLRTARTADVVGISLGKSIGCLTRVCSFALNKIANYTGGGIRDERAE